MKDGFIRVAAATPDIKVADPVYNEAQVWNMIEEGEKNGVKLMVFPELCLTGYTCGDLFHQDILVDTAADMLKKLIRRSEGHDVLFFVGLPWMKDGKLYNVAAAVHDGELLALITKKNIPNYSEFYELRHFTPGPDVPEPMEWDGRIVPFGSGILLRCVNLPELVVAGGWRCLTAKESGRIGGLITRKKREMAGQKGENQTLKDEKKDPII